MEKGSKLAGEPALAQGKTKSSVGLAKGSPTLIHVTALALFAQRRTSPGANQMTFMPCQRLL